MTDQEEDAVIGRLAKEHSEAKRRVSALDAELRRLGKVFESLSNAFSGPQDMKQGQAANIAQLPSAQELQSMADELEKAIKTRDETRKSLSQCGVD